ncbi:amidase [Rhodovarius crocodyli]|uniref:Amidase n=1 Tax=Rhodovarius crocodyli TaxID=1979269 RepID=A0A437M1P4_9PROT|nr:amidase [Rhodovarius crocodyli]RVT91639.1 amidase [Rhodovarius crocodyli]
MSDESLAFLPAWRLLEQLRAGQITSRALLELYLRRVERLNPRINAVIHLDAARARAAADAADAARAKGEWLGPLHGLPLTVKDTNNVAGWPSTWGDPALRDNVPARSAEIIRRLEAAGAVLFGKTNIPLNALDWQSYNAIHGTTRNPWNAERSPGGSSGGSAAAVAAGLTALELGSDAGGSIRIPAHFSGVYGHKPTPGLLPIDGTGRPGTVLENDLVVSGPLARGVRDLGLALDVLAGPAGPAARAWRVELPPPRGTQAHEFRVSVVLDSPAAEVDAAYQALISALAEKLKAAGARVTFNALPFADHTAHHATYLRLLRGSVSARLPEAVFTQAVAATEGQAGGNASFYVAQSNAAFAQRHRDWLLAEEARARLKADWSAFFEEYDVVIAPASTVPAFPLDEQRPREERTLRVNGRDADYNDQLFWAGLATLPSLPATSAPIGFVEGLPVGVQIVGPSHEDRTTLAFAAVLEALHGFAPPPGF